LGNIVMQKFECDDSAEFHILGLVDDTHPAPAQLLKDAVMRDSLPDHWGEMLGPEARTSQSAKKSWPWRKRQLFLNPYFAQTACLGE
jgi:hypothetical protein